MDGPDFEDLVSGRLLGGAVLDLGEPVEPLSEHVGARFEKKPVAVRLDDTAHHGKQFANVLPQLSGLPHGRHMHGLPIDKRIDCSISRAWIALKSLEPLESFPNRLLAGFDEDMVVTPAPDDAFDKRAEILDLLA